MYQRRLSNYFRFRRRRSNSRLLAVHSNDTPSTKAPMAAIDEVSFTTQSSSRRGRAASGSGVTCISPTLCQGVC